MNEKNYENFAKENDKDTSTKSIMKKYLQFHTFSMNFWGEGPFSDELLLSYDI